MPIKLRDDDWWIICPVFAIIVVAGMLLNLGYLWLNNIPTENPMKANEVTVNVGVTKNMGNYESLRLDYQMKVALGPDDKPGPSIDEAREYLFTKMTKDLAAADGGKDFVRK